MASSRERGTSPSARACSSRFDDAGSVFSASLSSAISVPGYALPPQDRPIDIISDIAARLSAEQRRKAAPVPPIRSATGGAAIPHDKIYRDELTLSNKIATSFGPVLYLIGQGNRTPAADFTELTRQINFDCYNARASTYKLPLRYFKKQGLTMKKLLATVAILSLISAPVFAQSNAAPEATPGVVPAPAEAPTRMLDQPFVGGVTVGTAVVLGVAIAAVAVAASDSNSTTTHH